MPRGRVKRDRLRRVFGEPAPRIAFAASPARLSWRAANFGYGQVAESTVVVTTPPSGAAATSSAKKRSRSTAVSSGFW
jgi:hypothetical protein